MAEQASYPEGEWVARIANITSWQGKIVIVPKGRIDMPIDTAQHLTVDSTRIRRELGYTEIVPPEEGLRRAIAWERANPHAPVKSPPPDYEEEDRILEELTMRPLN